MKEKIIKKAVWIAGSLMLMFSMAGCLDDDSGIEPEAVAYVSIFHAAPDAPDLDVVLDDRPLFNQPLEYTDYTNYLRFYTGEREIAFNSYNASNVLADTSVNFQPGKAYSVFVVDDVADLSTLIVEDNAETPSEDSALVRFVHLSPDAPEVDLSLAESDTTRFAGRQFKQITDFTEVSAATYSLAVTPTDGNEALVTAADVKFSPGGIYTVIIRGFAATPAGNNNSLSIQVIRNQ